MNGPVVNNVGGLSSYGRGSATFQVDASREQVTKLLESWAKADGARTYGSKMPGSSPGRSVLHKQKDGAWRYTATPGWTLIDGRISLSDAADGKTQITVNYRLENIGATPYAAEVMRFVHARQIGSWHRGLSRGLSRMQHSQVSPTTSGVNTVA